MNAKTAGQPGSSVERLYARVRGNPVVSALVLVGTVVIAIASFTDATNKLLALFSKPSPAAARTSLAQMNLPYTAEAFVASAASGDVTAVKLFLKAGMDPNTVSDRAGTALGSAAFNGHGAIVTALLDAGAGAGVGARSPSPLGSAAAGGHDDIVKALLDHRPAPDADAINEAFYMAARRQTFPGKRHYDTMKLLAARGADVKGTAQAVFDDVFSRGLGDDDARTITQALVELGADPNGAAGIEGKPVTEKTPVMGAAYEGYGATATWLLAHGARVDIRYDKPDSDERNCTALMLAALRRQPETVEVLIAHGAEVEAVDGRGRTALMLAAARGSAEVVQLLLAHGARVDARDPNGKRAIDYARASDPIRSVDVIPLLLPRR